MKKKQGSQENSAAAAEKEIVSVKPISDIEYLPDKSKNVSGTLGAGETCEVVVRFTPSRAGEQNLVANFSCDGLSKPVSVKTNKGNVRVVYLVLAEANGEMCFFRIGETGQDKLKVRYDFPLKVKNAKVAWDFKKECVWLGENGAGDFARFSPSGLVRLILEVHTGVTAHLRSLRWSKANSQYYAVGDHKTLIHTSSLERWTKEEDVVSGVSVSSNFMDIAFSGETSKSEIEYVIVGTNAVLVSKDKQGKLKHEEWLKEDREEGIGASAPISCIAYSDKMNCFAAIARAGRASKSWKLGQNLIISDFTTPTTWEVIGDSDLSKDTYRWNRIAWSETVKKFVCVGNAVALSTVDDVRVWDVKEMNKIKGLDPDVFLNEVIWTDLLGGAFIAVGTKRSVLYSKDGENWQVYIKPDEFGEIPEDAVFTGVDVVELPLTE